MVKRQIKVNKGKNQTSRQDALKSKTRVQGRGADATAKPTAKGVSKSASRHTATGPGKKIPKRTANGDISDQKKTGGPGRGGDSTASSELASSVTHNSPSEGLPNEEPDASVRLNVKESSADLGGKNDLASINREVKTPSAGRPSAELRDYVLELSSELSRGLDKTGVSGRLKTFWENVLAGDKPEETAVGRILLEIIAAVPEYYKSQAMAETTTRAFDLLASDSRPTASPFGESLTSGPAAATSDNRRNDEVDAGSTSVDLPESPGAPTAKRNSRRTENKPRTKVDATQPVVVNRRILGDEGRALAEAIAGLFQENPRSYENGIPGDVLEVTLRLRRVLEQLEGRWEIVSLLMRSIMPVTMRRLREETGLTPEQSVDLITAVLDGLRPRKLTETQDDEMLRFFAATRALLESQKSSLTDQDRGGYYATRNAIAQYISSGRPSPRVLRSAVFYFEEILYEYYLLMHRDPQFRLQERDRRSLEVAGNNGGNHLDDLRVRNADSAEIDRFWPKISGITVAVAVEENRGKVTRTEAEQIAGCFNKCFGENTLSSVGADAGFYVAVDVMMYGPGAWRSEFTSAQTVGMELSAALVRLVRLDRRTDAASPMFNAGVELLRMGQNSDGQRRPWERMLINTMGLWWSLSLNSEWLAALTESHGYSCLVNLWGAIADVKADISEDRQFAMCVQKLIQWTKACETIAPRELRDIERIRRSFSNIGNLLPAGAESTSLSKVDGLRILEELRECVLRRISPQSMGDKLPELASGQNEALLKAVEITALDFHTVLQSVPESRAIWSGMSKQVQKFVPEAGRTEQRIRERMQEIWGPDPRNELAAEDSILVRSKIMTSEEYQEVRELSRDPSRLPDFLFVEDCSYTWLER